jgi:hypothetical protein
VTRQVADDLAARHRVRDQGELAEVEVLDHRGEIVGERVVVIVWYWNSRPDSAQAEQNKTGLPAPQSR